MKKFFLCVISSIIIFNIHLDVNAQVSYNMELLSHLRPAPNNFGYSALWGYVAPDNREYAILGSEQGTHIIDITDSAVQVGFVISPVPGHFGNFWREMKVYSHYAYIVSEATNSGIQIIDLQYLPDSVSYVGKIDLPGHSSTHSISQSGSYLYLNGANTSFGSGTVIVDLSQNPEMPLRRGGWNNRYVHDSRIINDTIWACNIGSGHITIINAADKDNPVEITNWLNVPNPAPHNIALTNDRRYAFVTDETSSPVGRLKVWNVEDINNVTLERVWHPDGFANSIVHNIEIYDSVAVIAYYTAGIRVLDISDPVNFIEIGWYDTYPQSNNTGFNGCWGVYMFPSGKIIGSDMTTGLYVVKLLPQVPGVPVANFSVSNQNIVIGDSIKFTDLSTGIPTSWEWSVTGPVSFYSVIQNPTFTFNDIGNYSVKLKVSNSFGSDSLIRINYISVRGVPLSPFTLSGATFQTVITSQADTSQYFFNWTRASQTPLVNYKVRLKNLFGQEEFVFNSSGNGADTVIGFRKSFLDSLSYMLNPQTDSSRLSVRVWAYNGSDSVSSGNAVVLTVKRTTVGISTNSEEIPSAYSLKQNFPNPFNPSTQIEFALPKQGFVSLKVYDIMGREVATLVNENLDAGYYNYQLTTNNYQIGSGIYFYRLKAGEYREVRRMLLLK